MKKGIVVMSLFAFTLFVTGCTSMGTGMTEKDTVSIKNTKKIVVESSSADIEIVPEERDDISIVLRTYKRGPRLEISDGKTVRIEAKDENWLNFGFSINSSPRLIIYIPKDYRESLDIKNSSGDLDINDFELNGLNIDLSSGDMKGNTLSFEKGILKSSSGDIELTDIECSNLSITSHSGDLSLDDFEGALNGTSNSGEVFIGYKKLNGDLDYLASSGNITVDFNNANLDAKFDLKCSSGNISLDYDLDDVKLEKENSVSGTSGKGIYAVTLNASSGDITVR
ncbi:MAG: hypothetical protein CVU84_15090 [Firmicutes bacterium HGW-Firmicutes-1]|jgi:DUF4097 and DUF4098 domain-containing protein YvlB|nr:MAG: hypothetical protein CVU84_15090 [Firmicutes bacterium HGW-Firmicutes-1]